MMKINLTIFILLLTFGSALMAQDATIFPYGAIPAEKPDMPLSAAMARVYDGSYKGVDCFLNELFTNFKFSLSEAQRERIEKANSKVK